MHWLYLHGFLSSPRSGKAQALKRWVEAEHGDVSISVPTLPFNPLAAIEIIQAVIDLASRESRPVSGVIGSSLGGFYARAIAAKHSIPTVLVNPALRPDLLLVDYLGEQLNPYTGERHYFSPSDLGALKTLLVHQDPDPQRLFLLVQMNDETLDSAQTVAHLSKSPAWIQSGGSHRFDHFECTFPAIKTFLSSSTC